MSTEPEHDDLAQDLHAMRAEPRAEFASELDRRAAGWLRERPRRRLPALRIAIPAVAAATAAAVVALIVVSGGDDGGGGGADKLEVAVMSEGAAGFAAPQGGGPGGGPGAPEEDSLGAPIDRGAPKAAGGAFLLPSTEEGTVTVRYLFGAPTEATVSLAGREAEIVLEPGTGSLEISTEGLPAGAHDLTITTPSAPTYRKQIQIGG